MTPSELKYHVDATGSHFFDRKTMKFFGDTMKNFGVVADTIDTYTETGVKVWRLFRRKPVKHGLFSDEYFRQDNFKRAFAKGEGR